MQKYGKTLYHDRFSPIFYNFAIKLTVRETNSLQKNTTNNSNNEILQDCFFRKILPKSSE